MLIRHHSLLVRQLTGCFVIDIIFNLSYIPISSTLRQVAKIWRCVPNYEWNDKRGHYRRRRIHKFGKIKFRLHRNKTCGNNQHHQTRMWNLQLITLNNCECIKEFNFCTNFYGHILMSFVSREKKQFKKYSWNTNRQNFFVIVLICFTERLNKCVKHEIILNWTDYIEIWL